MDLHRRLISEAQMLSFEGFMAEILTAFEWICTLRPPEKRPDALFEHSSLSPMATTAIRNSSRCSPPNAAGDGTAGGAR